MASQSQIKEFIERLAPIAQAAYRDLGKIKPSICIAMACVECAYGTAGSCKHNSYFGQKVGTGKTATKYWSGKFFTSKTGEEYKVGVHTIINAAFRSYDSLEQATYNYYELLNTSLYSKVKAESDYIDQMKQIKACGYMTSSTEVNSVLSIINKYDLTKYDGPSIYIENATDHIDYTKFPVLRKGSKGSAVQYLQILLNEHGFKCDIDGIFGSVTAARVIEAQGYYGLTKDAVVGKLTWAELVRK